MQARIKPLLVITALVVGLVVLLLFGLQLASSDAVKTRLEALLSERTGLTTRIAGDVRWRYLWPTAITLHQVQAQNGSGSENWQADSLRLRVSSVSILSAPRNPERWRVVGFKVLGLRGNRGASATASSALTSQATGDRQADSYAIDAFEIDNLSEHQAAPFMASLAYRGTVERAVELQLDGNLRFAASERKLQFEPANISGPQATGRCTAAVALRPISQTPPAAPAAEPDPALAILNLDLWRRSDWNLQCALQQLRIRGETFTDVTLNSDNQLGNSLSELRLPAFFGGTAALTLAIDASDAQLNTGQASPHWALAPNAENVASAALLSWLQTSAQAADPATWEGPVQLAGRIETSGNSRAAMLNAATGEVVLRSNDGTVNLTQLKQSLQRPLAELRGLIGSAERIRNWPERLHYAQLQARWLPTAGQQQLSGRLDNLTFAASGLISAESPSGGGDTLRANGTLTFRTEPPPISLPVPALLEDLPLPLACSGTLATPACALDSAASKRLLADVLKGDGPNGLSQKIDSMIEEQVPEEYQRAARSLLEILGHSIDDTEASELEAFLIEELEQESSAETSAR